MAAALSCASTAALAAPVGDGTAPYLTASGTVAQEHNLYRLAPGQAAPAGASRDDTVHTSGASAAFDKRWGRHRLRMEGTLRQTSHDRNRQLDGTSGNFSLASELEVRGPVSLSLSYLEGKTLRMPLRGEVASTADTQRNVVDTQQAQVVARFGTATRLGAELGVEDYRIGYSAPGFMRLDRRQDSATARLVYRRPALAQLSAAVRVTEGRYPHFRPLAGGGFQADRFSRQDVEFGVDWLASPSSSLTVKGGPSRIHHADGGLRDTSAVTGRVAWLLRPTGKLRLGLEGWHEIGQSSQAAEALENPAYATTNRTQSALRLSVNEDLTGKIALSASATFTRFAQASTLVAAGAAGPALLAASSDEADRVVNLALGARWELSRNVVLSCDLKRERWHSTSKLPDGVLSQGVGCTGQLLLW